MINDNSLKLLKNEYINDEQLKQIAADVLNIDLKNYTETDIKRAYRDLANKYHPDKNGEEYVTEFEIIAAAYKILEKRLSNTNDYTNDYTIDNSAEKIQASVQYIPGTNILKPRVRNTYESEQEYVKFLEEYYSNAFRKDINSIDSFKSERDKYSLKLISVQNELSDIISKEALLYSKMQSNDDIINQMNELKNRRDELTREYQELIAKIKEIDNKILELQNKEKTPDQEIKALPQGKEIPRLPSHIDRGNDDYDEEEKEEEKEDKEFKVRNLDGIIDEITSGLMFKQKDNKKYTYSNIKVAKAFANGLRSGNYLYNIAHFIPATLGCIMSIPKKLIGKLTYNSKIRKNVEVLKERLSNLPEEDLMILFKKYNSTNVIGKYGLPSIVNTVILETIKKFVMKKVAVINKELEQNYSLIYCDYQQILALKAQIESIDVPQEQKNACKKQMEKLISGKSSVVKRIRTLQDDAADWLSGSGLHGFEQDVKASMTKLSLKGKRFAKIPNFDTELMHKQHTLKDGEDLAIQENNDEQALVCFLNYENLLSQNTQIKHSIFGKRSVGSRYYTPLAMELDYRDDPFVRDLFTTIAITTASIGAINGIITQIKLKKANMANEAAIKQAQQVGKDINSKNDTIIEGQKRGIYDQHGEYTNLKERQVLDVNDWQFNDKYRSMDKAAHSDYTSFYNDTVETLEGITKEYASKGISASEAMQKLSELASKNDAKLQHFCQEYLPQAQQYAASHPQFDLSAVTDNIEKIMSTSGSIANAYGAQAEVAALAQTLEALQFAGAPGDLLTTLAASAGSVMLVANVNNSIKNNFKNNKYGNLVTTMVGEVNQQDLQDYTEEVNSRVR